jgi:hypothetical protein
MKLGNGKGVDAPILWRGLKAVDNSYVGHELLEAFGISTALTDAFDALANDDLTLDERRCVIADQNHQLMVTPSVRIAIHFGIAGGAHALFATDYGLLILIIFYYLIFIMKG